MELSIDIGRTRNLYYRITESECWECTRLKPKKDGRYYQIMTGSRSDNSRKVKLLHRYMYEYFKEPIPEGLILRHTCDNVLCVNIEHLILGTHKDNSNDMVIRGRSTKGEKSATSKLKDSDRKEIIDLYASKLFNQTELSNLYGVSQRQISNVVRNKY